MADKGRGEVGNSRIIENLCRRLKDGEVGMEEAVDYLYILKSCMDILPDFFAVVDLQGKMLLWNESVERITGYTGDELAAMQVFDLFDAEDVPAITEGFRRLIQEGTYTNEGRLVTKRGEKIPYELRGGVLKNEKGEPVAICGTGRDISERKHLEKELEARNEELEAFAHTISHDIRTPLSVIEGYAKTVLESEVEERALTEKECLENIVRGAKKISRMIESLLAYASAAGPSRGEKRAVPMEVLREIVQDLETHFKESGVELRIKGELPPVAVDPFKLGQVFYNLLDNAVKYHRRGIRKKWVEISARRSGREILFAVKDNGGGIPASRLASVFEPFRRCTEEEEGLGIGLATVKRAVESWGGRIWVESELNRGSTFYFTTPPAPP
jgi:PAS domain S-box-containing protein